MASNSFNNIINSDTPVLIDFFATWCGPCKAFAPILQDIKSEIGDQARVLKIDIDRNQALANKLGIRSVPTIQLYHKGNLKWQAAGVQPKQVILAEIKKVATA